MRNRILYAHLAVFIVQVIYAANYSIAKQLMPAFIQPYGIIVLRVIPSAILFFLVSAFFKSEKILRRDKFTLILCAMFGVAINQLLFFKGLSLTSPVNGAIIMTTNPILVMLFASIALKEKITASRITGIIAGLTGALALILFGKKLSDAGSSTGDLLIFVNSFSFAIFLIIVKPLFTRYHPLTITKWIFFFGSLMILPFGFEEVKLVQWNTFTPIAWSALMFVIIAVTFVAYLLNIYSLRALSPSVVSSYIYLQPVIATLISIMFGFGKPHWLHLVSTVLIFTGVYLVSKPGASQPVEKLN